MNIKTTSSHKRQEPEIGVLYIVGTPIGNLSDISLRALNILRDVSLIACEDTRQTKKLMSKYNFTNNFISFNEHNSRNKIPRIINDLHSGNSVALVSDAGMPSICDPGEELINHVKTNGINIICIPGPCAAITAIASSGFPSSKFTFEGFLPKKKSEREKILREISQNDKTTILFESPHRLKKLLKELKDFCGGGREIQISRELTKMYEENIRNNINEIIDHFEGEEVLGEITIVIRGITKLKKNSEFDNFKLKKELHDLIAAGVSLTAASKYLAKKNNLTKNLIYNMYQS
ncbi:16S rRNA (cytidine(1402)-2'-O)-methyltransferase [Prochlorococcus marinus]|uniref:16S rRNA (cytidine(1402)-2'-O)-methyltransferase n=1 Tax=Prochlorococcus marinus TaxID=1219 RepID=UPI001ADA0B5E|nr:16S rRNA (cytidine(1402)-2'-O)-methyltransferase [Prochlorococcus marinus]MBO8204921.1 16S rRNA (cytidine(1402)-2'-O)-methyltransferase [Prochlorococcus marinus CUG1415]MBW3044193.1 16S rRNA (cytidine(1402)-2'-O)-methyltransferase [Prochlorococcus marinus str. MU1415]